MSEQFSLRINVAFVGGMKLVRTFQSTMTLFRVLFEHHIELATSTWVCTQMFGPSIPCKILFWKLVWNKYSVSPFRPNLLLKGCPSVPRNFLFIWNMIFIFYFTLREWSLFMDREWKWGGDINSSASQLRGILVRKGQNLSSSRIFLFRLPPTHK